MKFEYLYLVTRDFEIKEIHYNFNPKPQVKVNDEIDTAFDHLGENGWELVGATPRTGVKHDSHSGHIPETVGYVFWFKRPYNWNQTKA